jgi:hypothetical protein
VYLCLYLIILCYHASSSNIYGGKKSPLQWLLLLTLFQCLIFQIYVSHMMCMHDEINIFPCAASSDFHELGWPAEVFDKAHIWTNILTTKWTVIF